MFEPTNELPPDRGLLAVPLGAKLAGIDGPVLTACKGMDMALVTHTNELAHLLLPNGEVVDTGDPIDLAIDYNLGYPTNYPQWRDIFPWANFDNNLFDE